jgi:predicted nicotinamide N-methyase
LAASPAPHATVATSNLQAFDRPLTFQRLPLCPEIGLWLLDADLDLEASCRGLERLEAPPFWAFCWGSGQAMARFILDHPERFRGKRIVDFGTGSGVAAIAAALAGAARVDAVDVDPQARRATALNAQSNRVEIATHPRLPKDWDLLVASDILYEPQPLDRLRPLVREGRPILLSDPERPSSPRLGLPSLARYAVRTLPDVDSPACSAAIFEFGPENLTRV